MRLKRDEVMMAQLERDDAFFLLWGATIRKRKREKDGTKGPRIKERGNAANLA
jgi:hypothetical protein